MLLDKPYWINTNKKEEEYFENMSLLHLKNIINTLRKTYASPHLHPTYNYAVAIYQARIKLLPIPYLVDGKQVGYTKCGKLYLEDQDYLDRPYHDIISNQIEKKFLMDTRIPIGSIDFKGMIEIKEDRFIDD